MPNGLVALLYLGLLGGIYALVFWLNKKTPVPAGCENLKAECEGCKDFTCGNNPAQGEIEKM